MDDVDECDSDDVNVDNVTVVDDYGYYVAEDNDEDDDNGHGDAEDDCDDEDDGGDGVVESYCKYVDTCCGVCNWFFVGDS